MKLVNAVKMKSAEFNGFSLELFSEDNGTVYRVNIFDGSTPRTRVFSNYDEASALFDSYLQGN